MGVRRAGTSARSACPGFRRRVPGAPTHLTSTMDLTHYLVVRRDLPLGALLAQLAHAAGESFFLLAEVAQKTEHPGGEPEPVTPVAVSAEEVGGSSPSLGSISGGGERRLTSDGASRSGEVGSQPAYPAKPKPTVVVLGARNEQKLLRLQAQLRLANIPHVAIREPDAPFLGQLTAIGVVPAAREAVARYFRDFQTLRSVPD
jgi:peptidyl-tRNA hydrolase